MNVLLINYDFPPLGGGAANAVYNIAYQLTLLGNEVSVMTSAYKNLNGYTYENNIHLYRVPSLRKYIERSNIPEMISFVKAGYRYLPDIVKERKIERTIVFYTIPCGPLGLFLKNKFNIPYIISLRGGDVPFHVQQLNFYHRVLKKYRQKILRNAQYIVANSESFANLSMQTDPFPVKVIPNGVDTEFFKPESLKFNNDIFHILFVGRFQPEKNLFYLLNEIQNLKLETCYPELRTLRALSCYAEHAEVLSKWSKCRKVKLHLVGDGPLKARILQKINLLGLTENIVLHGWLKKEELKTLYNSCHCLVNPSLGEGMPNVVLEAMACGLPVIASNVRGNDAVVIHDETGYLFDLNNPVELHLYLLEMMKNSGLREQFGINSRVIALQSFSWSNTAKLYNNLIQSV